MKRLINSRLWNVFSTRYGMVVVLLALCVFFSVVTCVEQPPTGPDAAQRLASAVAADPASRSGVFIVVGQRPGDAAFAEELDRLLKVRSIPVVGEVRGEPRDARRAIERLAEGGGSVGIFACSQGAATWGVYGVVQKQFSSLRSAKVCQPEGYLWPAFLKADNLLNIANQIAVIALIAIGMTAVILTGGIDLSVGSLIALSAVITARLIRDAAGAESASALGMILASLCGIGVCTVSGVFSGFMVTLFRIPPFIITLAAMLVASGLAYILADGQSINQVPERFVWLGRGADLFHVPNAVLLMFVLYALAHVVMTRMVFGRYVYAVGGNAEAARLCGVPVRGVLVTVYACSGALAGLGGVVMASQLRSGSPTYGQMYELYIIAAVVVGGTSLTGGKGTMLGTLVGAFIIAVIQNGMNLTGVESYTQKIVLGLVILGAVLLDRLRPARGRGMPVEVPGARAGRSPGILSPRTVL